MTGMHDGADEEGRLPSAAGSHADFSGTGRIVVQARDVRGPVNMFDLGRAEELPVPRQLPRDAAWLVGREEELAFLDRMLPGPADGAHGGAAPTVSVVSGMAGAGKTSLAVHWAHRVIGHYPDGQLYADLRGYASEDRELAARVLDRFLRSLGIPDDRVPSDPQEKECLYRSLLASRSIIVLLDNAASAAQVRPLLPGSGECAVVITSRSTLAGLDGAAYQTLEPLSQADSIRLLRRVLPDTREDGDAELGELAEACAHLPLALRIAAQRAAHRPMVPLAEMLRALRSSEKRWDALSMQNGNEAEAVHSVFAWSYHALLPTTAGFFRLLGGHPGPDISIEAAAALTGTGVERAEVELDRLADAHLVEHSGPRRHRMHDLTAAYARDRMGAQETAEAVDASWRRMFEWYLEAGYRAHRHMDNYGAHFPLEIEIPASGTAPVFVDRAEAAAWCDVEWPNLLAVVNAAIEQGRHELAWKLAATLRFMYHRADRRQAGLALLEAGLRSARLLGDVRAQGIILDSLTQMYSYLRRFPECRAAGEAAIAIWHGLGDHYREAVSRMIGSSESKRGRDWPRLIAMLEDVLAVAEDLGQVRLKAANLGNLGEVMLRRGDLQRASELIEQALEIHRELDWPTGLADTLWNSSRVMRGAAGSPTRRRSPRRPSNRPCGPPTWSCNAVRRSSSRWSGRPPATGGMRQPGTRRRSRRPGRRTTAAVRRGRSAGSPSSTGTPANCARHASCTSSRSRSAVRPKTTGIWRSRSKGTRTPWSGSATDAVPTRVAPRRWDCSRNSTIRWRSRLAPASSRCWPRPPRSSPGDPRQPGARRGRTWSSSPATTRIERAGSAARTAPSRR